MLVTLLVPKSLSNPIYPLGRYFLAASFVLSTLSIQTSFAFSPLFLSRLLFLSRFLFLSPSLNFFEANALESRHSACFAGAPRKCMGPASPTALAWGPFGQAQQHLQPTTSLLRKKESELSGESSRLSLTQNFGLSGF